MTALQQETVTDPAGPTGLLATWVAELTLDDVPPPVVDRAKHLLLDGIGCALVGAQLPWSRIATDAVLALEEAATASSSEPAGGPAHPRPRSSTARSSRASSSTTFIRWPRCTVARC